MGNQRISGWTIRSYDSFRIGDFDNDGFDELLCLQFGGYWATVLHFDSGFPVWGWSNYGTGGIAGWGNPLKYTDAVLVGDMGDIDEKDSKNELKCIYSIGVRSTL